MRIVAIAMSSLLLSACGAPNEPAGLALDWPAGRLIDLTHPFDDQTVYWPTAEGFRLTVEADGQTGAGYYYAANSFCAAEHGGTHLDAPRHFAEGRWTADEIPLERLTGRGALIDVSRQAAADRDYQMQVADLQEWEARHGTLPEGVILLIRTGFGSYWPDRVRYLGTAERGEAGVAQLHFPGVSPEAARWLVANRNIAAIGIDTASIDHGQSKLFDSHQALFAANIPAFENLAGLDQLPETGFLVVALPMKIRGGSGGPLRIIAVIPD